MNIGLVNDFIINIIYVELLFIKLILYVEFITIFNLLDDNIYVYNTYCELIIHDMLFI